MGYKEILRESKFWYLSVSKYIICKDSIFCTIFPPFFEYCYVVMSNEYCLSKIIRGYKKLLRESKFWYLSVSGYIIYKDRRSFAQFLLLFSNIVMIWNCDTEKITLMKKFLIFTIYLVDIGIQKLWLFSKNGVFWRFN